MKNLWKWPLLLVFVTVLCFGVAAADEVSSGPCGENLIWTLDSNNQLTISGSGAFDSDAIPDDVRQTAEKVCYGQGINSIPAGSFSYCYSLTEFAVDPGNLFYTTADGVLYNKEMTDLIECPTAKIGTLVIPENVVIIRENAFVGSYLDSITLPSTLESIGSQAFWGSNITEITLPASYQGYKASVFNCCDAMTAFYVADENPNYAAVNGFLYTKDMTTIIRVPCGYTGSLTLSGVTRIDDGACQQCGNLTSVTLSEGVKTIGRSAFLFSGIQTIDLPRSLETIDEHAFENADQLQTVNYAGTIAEWNQIVISDDNMSLLSKIIHCSDGNVEPKPMTGSIGDGITYVLTLDGDLTVTGAGEWNGTAFDTNQMITHATLEEGVTEVGRYGFFHCRNLQEVILPNTVTQLRDGAFYYCASLETITIPATVTLIGEEVFEGCESLTEITFGGTIAQWQALVDGSNNDMIANFAIHCSDGSINDSHELPKNACGDNLTWTLDEWGTLTISGSGAMYDYMIPGNPPPWRWDSAAIGYVDFADGVTHIGSYAFWYCTNIDVIPIPASVTSIGQYAFGNCLSLTEVDYSGSRAGWEAISINEAGNEYLLAATLICANPDEDQTSVSFDAASGCLTISGTGMMPSYEVSFDSGYCATGAPWYDYHDSITSVVIESGITAISSGAFSGCSHLAEVSLPETITEIGSHAFNGCSALTEISIPDGVNSIHPGTFSGCTSLAHVGFPEQLLVIDHSAFSYCSSLTSLEFPSKLTTIRYQAFSDCSGLTSITLPASLKSIDSVAFANCGLTDIHVSGSTLTHHFFYSEENGNHLYHIDLPSGLTALDDSAFYSNPLPSDTPDFILPSGLTAIEPEAFSGTDARFVWLPDGIASIGANAFADSQVKYVYVPYGCDSIGEGAFPPGTIILGDSIDLFSAGYAKTWAAQNDCLFILLLDPYSGNG